MAGDVEPHALAQLLETAERPRSSQWSFRAALTRYAQPQPQRSSETIELLRRMEAALRPHAKTLERDGPKIWSAMHATSDPAGADVDPALVELLRVLAELDRLGDVIVAWAIDRSGERPDGAVDTAIADLAHRLERLGIHREVRPTRSPPRRG